MAASADKVMAYMKTQMQQQPNLANKAMGNTQVSVPSMPSITGDEGNVLKMQNKKGQNNLQIADSLLSFSQSLGA